MKERIEFLRSEIARHNHLYYVQNNPQITDQQFDAMFVKLVELETEYPEYADPNSPTQRVGSDLSNAFPKVPHPFPMLSIETVFQITGKLTDNMLKHEGPYFTALKYDGTAIELNYDQNGHLRLALSRGNGYEGHDVTANVKTIKTIPLSIPRYNGPAFTVRGEVFLTKDNFKAINKIRKKQHLDLYNNIRNASSALLKAKLSATTAQAKLDAVFFYFQTDNNKPIPTINQLAQLHDLGFAQPHIELFSSLHDAISQAQATNLNNLPFPADGVVIKSNLVLHNKNTRYQSGAWALKSNSPLWETHLRFVSWSVSSRGKLTPVAHFDIITDCGANYPKASLLSIDNFNKLNLKENALLRVQIAGNTTPQVIEATGGTEPIQIPTICPDCHQPLIDNRCENDIWCPSRDFDYKQVNFPHAVEVELHRSPIDGPAIFKTACLNQNAIIARTVKHKHDYMLLADNLQTVANVAVQVGRITPGPFSFEERTKNELLHEIQEADKRRKSLYI